MSKNVGTTDRVIRAVIGVGAAAGGVVVGAGTIGGIVLLVVAVIALGTAAVGLCPLYKFVGLSTCPAR